MQICPTYASRASGLLAALLLTSATNAQDAPLMGRVATSRGEPLVGALVTAERDGDVLATARTEGTGTFRFAALPAGAVIVRAATKDQVGAVALAAHQRIAGFVSLVAGPARVLRGTVHDAQGTALAGTWLAAVPVGAPELACFGVHATSAADGTFTLGPLPLGPVTVRAFARDHEPAGMQVERDAVAPLVLACGSDVAAPHRFTLDGFAEAQRATARLRVTMLNQRAELPLPAWLAQPTLGDDGAFAVAAAHAADDLRVQLTVDGVPTEPAHYEFAPGANSRTRAFTPMPDEAVPVRGKVTLASGTVPANGMQLVLGIDGRLFPLRTDATGAFATSFTVAANTEIEVQVREPGWALALPIGMPFPELPPPFQDRHRPERPLEVVLMRGASLRGRAVNDRGEPMAGARVHLMHGGNHELHTVRGGDVPSSGQIAIGCTDAEGRFELVDVTPWRSMLLQITGPTGTLAQLTDLEADERRDLGTLQLGPAASVHGVVRDAEGKPQPGAWLRVEIWSGACHEFVMAADADGAFVLPGLPVGRALIARLGSRQAVNVELCAGERSEVPPLPQ